MKAFIKGNNNPKHIVDAFKSYIDVMYAEEFDNPKQLEEFKDQLPKCRQLPRDEVKKMKQRSIPRAVQLEFVNSLPESSLDRLRMKCLAMAQLSSSRRYNDIVNCRVDDFRISEYGKGYRLHILHGKGGEGQHCPIAEQGFTDDNKLMPSIISFSVGSASKNRVWI